MKTPIRILTFAAVLALSACDTLPKKKHERPDVAPVRESFSRNADLIDELEAVLKTNER
jgi:hypothetical protein